MTAVRRYVSSSSPRKVHIGMRVQFRESGIRAEALCGAQCDEILAAYETPGTPADARMVNCQNCQQGAARIQQELVDALAGIR